VINHIGKTSSPERRQSEDGLHREFASDIFTMDVPTIVGDGVHRDSFFPGSLVLLAVCGPD
jgi:hypothetical protein